MTRPPAEGAHHAKAYSRLAIYHQTPVQPSLVKAWHTTSVALRLLAYTHLETHLFGRAARAIAGVDPRVRMHAVTTLGRGPARRARGRHAPNAKRKHAQHARRHGCPGVHHPAQPRDQRGLGAQLRRVAEEGLVAHPMGAERGIHAQREVQRGAGKPWRVLLGWSGVGHMPFACNTLCLRCLPVGQYALCTPRHKIVLLHSVKVLVLAGSPVLHFTRSDMQIYGHVTKACKARLILTGAAQTAASRRHRPCRAPAARRTATAAPLAARSRWH